MKPGSQNLHKYLDKSKTVSFFSLVHEKGGGSFLAGRTWSGVEQRLGETEVSGVVQGRRGIAAGYEGEGDKT